jgi:multidrug efflux pump subunit AcrA (membrane-fusion protein)
MKAPAPRWLPLAAVASIAGHLLACDSVADPERWVRLSREDWSLGVEVAGILKATVADTLGPPQLGQFGEYKIARMAAEGARVKQGDEVVAFDTSDLERQLLERQNERDAAAAEIARRISDATLRRRDEALGIAECEGAVRKAALKAEGSADLTSSLELQTARLDHELAQKRLAYQRQKALASRQRDDEDLGALREKHARAEQRVADAQSSIARMHLLAPRDATIIYLPNFQGQKKKVGDGVWRGENVLETASLDEMIALGDVAEGDISRLVIGQRVSLRLEAHPDTEYRGQVRAIGNLVEPPAPDSRLQVVRVQIVLDAAEPLRMRPGMRFAGTIETEQLSRALHMPLDAVFLRPEGPVAYKRTGAGFEPVQLSLGRAYRGDVEVLAGVAEGDQVARVDLGRADDRAARGAR